MGLEVARSRKEPVTYKIWLEIEEVNEDGDPIDYPTLEPLFLKEVDTAEEAEDFRLLIQRAVLSMIPE